MMRVSLLVRCTSDLAGHPELNYKLGPYDDILAANKAWEEFLTSKQPNGYTCKASFETEILK
jgi:hypothetical protein